MALVGACPEQHSGTLCGLSRCSWDVPGQWWGYEATAEDSKALCGTWTWVQRGCIKPWGVSLPAAELFWIPVMVPTVTPWPVSPIWDGHCLLVQQFWSKNTHCKLCLYRLKHMCFSGQNPKCPHVFPPALTSLLCRCVRWWREGCWQTYKIHPSVILSSCVLWNNTGCTAQDVWQRHGEETAIRIS